VVENSVVFVCVRSCNDVEIFPQVL